MTLMEQTVQGIARLMVQEKLFDLNQVITYQTFAQENGQTLLQYLNDNKLVSAEKIAMLIAQNIGLPFLDLDCINANTLPLNLMNKQLILQYNILPLFTRNNQLFLAIADPSNYLSLKNIQFHTGLNVQAIIVESHKLHKLIEQLFPVEQDWLVYDESNFASNHLAPIINSLNFSDKLITSLEDEVPVVKFINKILFDATKKRASDIHFEPYEKEFRVRYRIDGLLIAIVKPPLELANRVSARIKVMANLDTSERRMPQDGGFKMKLSSTQIIHVRVSTCPTVSGEKVVMRILNPEVAKIGIETLGFNPQQKELFLQALQKTQGMILITGPTGSGKTVSLYAALNLLNTVERNITTIEDPIEIKIPGINQVNINPKAGFNFSQALRAFLRQDPDIIMVGEMRDFETAEIAVKAAHTGHLVLSTLHTNSAAETLKRLLNMGIPSFNIISSISLVIAQRLVRKLCNDCKIIEDEINPAILIKLGLDEGESQNIKLYQAKGCQHCTNGYYGRIGLFEVMPLTKTLSHLILSGGFASDILKQAQQEGMLTLYQSGLEKVKDGVTTLAEIERVTIDYLL